jgi:hypothetical protein
VSLPALSEAQLVKAIKEHISKGDQHKGKSEQHYISAGQHLKTLKALHDGNWSEWEELLKEKCGIGKSRASELMRIADGTKTVEEVRSDTAQRMVRHRQTSPSRDGENRREALEEAQLDNVAQPGPEADDAETARDRAEVRRLYAAAQAAEAERKAAAADLNERMVAAVAVAVEIRERIGITNFVWLAAQLTGECLEVDDRIDAIVAVANQAPERPVADPRQLDLIEWIRPAEPLDVVEQSAARRKAEAAADEAPVADAELGIPEVNRRKRGRPRKSAVAAGQVSA